jgi:hypothetical protein
MFYFFIITFFLVFLPWQIAQAIAPVLVPIFASILEILSGLILFITAPALIMVAIIAFFGLRYQKTKKGKLQLKFNPKIFIINSVSLAIYIIIVVIATFFLLKYKYNLVFILAQKIEPRQLSDLIAGTTEIQIKKTSLSNLLSSFLVIMITVSVFLSALAELMRMILYREKIFINFKIFFQDLVWISLFTLIIIFLTIFFIYYYYQPYFI